jgi:hypothetical protein
MATFKYVLGDDGAKHVNWLQKFGVSCRNGTLVYLYYAGPYGPDNRYNNFGFKHLLFPSKKGTDTATKALNRAKRRADIDSADQAKSYRDGWQRHSPLQPGRTHEDGAKGVDGQTKYGKVLGQNTTNSYIDLGVLSFDIFNSLVAEQCLTAFKTVQQGSKDVTFKLGKPAVCGVSATGAVAVPTSTFPASVFKQAQNAYHIFHFANEA